MIEYALACRNGHSFDAWFRSAAAYAEQAGRGIVTCPICGSAEVDKALMAPALSGLSRVEADAAPPAERMALASGHPDQAELRAALRALRQRMMKHADYVGDRFASEARRIHEREIDPRGIYGEATREEVAGLIEDGIEFMPLPSLPEDHN